MFQKQLHSTPTLTFNSIVLAKEADVSLLQVTEWRGSRVHALRSRTNVMFVGIVLGQENI